MGRRKTSDKKTLRLCSAVVLAVLITVTFSGCTENLEESQDTVNIYVYEDAGGKGDPEKQIQEFYDIALQEAGEPVIKPVAQYAVELDPDTGGIISIYDSDGNPVDQETALAMQDDIVRDDAGNIITDAALLDLHINPIGKDKYEILNLKQELQVEDGIWRVKGTENPSFDKDFVDNIIKVGDNKDEMYGALVRGNDGNIYGVIIVDEDVFSMYGENSRYGVDFGIGAKGVNPKGIVKEKCMEVAPGLYAYLYNLSETPNGSAVVQSPFLLSEEAHIAKETNNGKYAQFMFVKENS